VFRDEFSFDPHTFTGRGPRATEPRCVVHDAQSATRSERAGQVAQEGHPVLDLWVDVHHENRIERTVEQIWIADLAEARCNVLESLARHASCESGREPSSAGADVSDPRSIGDGECVHDLIRLLPDISVWRLEKSEILERKEITVALRRQRVLRRRRSSREHGPEESDGNTHSGAQHAQNIYWPDAAVLLRECVVAHRRDLDEPPA
jgi:hypothetical protein